MLLASLVNDTNLPWMIRGQKATITFDAGSARLVDRASWRHFCSALAVTAQELITYTSAGAFQSTSSTAGYAATR